MAKFITVTLAPMIPDQQILNKIRINTSQIESYSKSPFDGKTDIYIVGKEDPFMINEPVEEIDSKIQFNSFG